MDTWCCRVASLDVGSAHGLVLHSLFALWPRGISFGPGHRWALELHSRALWYPVSAWLGSWWHEKRQIGTSPARVTLIRERVAQSADHLAEKRQNGLFWVRWSAIWANPETRQTRPPTTATFPRNTADKSPPQQHVVSYNPRFAAPLKVRVADNPATSRSMRENTKKPDPMVRLIWWAILGSNQ